MSLRSPQVDSVRDPYNLDRLAEDLAYREQRKKQQNYALQDGGSDEHKPHSLPDYVPLNHDNIHLTASTFNVEEFLLSRSNTTSLLDLRSELRDYLATLKRELVQLINDDYEAFISLSTDLRGEGARLESMKRPLGDLKARVLVRRRGAADPFPPLTQQCDRKPGRRCR